MLDRLRAANHRIETSWIGDLIGVAALFGSLWAGLVIGHALSGGVQ